ncbi:DNA recombination protein RmuC [Arthrobacter halodurans]|uniref:DNA recombination protein RmuC n=1 Tax=Arthrobacter halodurans TaxID=516699 RepID=A0ABV4UPS8_9MICC
MDAFGWLVAGLTLLLGALAGAGSLWWFAVRGSLSGLRAENDDAARRLGEASNRLAGAEAENALLRAHAAEDRERGRQDHAVLAALSPVAEKLRQVQSQVALLERDRVEQYGQLSQQLVAAAEQDAALLRTTSSLAGALRNNAARGVWGEVQLRRVVEAAGMLEHVDFSEQVVTPGGQRPDLVVSLPGGKSVAVDAKVPLNSYLEAQELDTDADPGLRARQAELLAAHAKALRAHVDTLGSKRYWDGVAGSPELVVCFLPAESFLAAALSADPGLLDHAFSKNVALASPATLLSILKGLAFAWRQELLTENARALFDQSRELYERLGTMGGHVARLGGSLKASVEKYNAFVGALESRVLPSARRIQELDPGLGSAAASGRTRLEAPPLESTPRVLSATELLDERQLAENATGGRDGADGASARAG